MNKQISNASNNSKESNLSRISSLTSCSENIDGFIFRKNKNSQNNSSNRKKSNKSDNISINKSDKSDKSNNISINKSDKSNKSNKVSNTSYDSIKQTNESSMKINLISKYYSSLTITDPRSIANIDRIISKINKNNYKEITENILKFINLKLITISNCRAKKNDDNSNIIIPTRTIKKIKDNLFISAVRAYMNREFRDYYARKGHKKHIQNDMIIKCIHSSIYMSTSKLLHIVFTNISDKIDFEKIVDIDEIIKIINNEDNFDITLNKIVINFIDTYKTYIRDIENKSLDNFTTSNNLDDIINNIIKIDSVLLDKINNDLADSSQQNNIDKILLSRIKNSIDCFNLVTSDKEKKNVNLNNICPVMGNTDYNNNASSIQKVVKEKMNKIHDESNDTTFTNNTTLRNNIKMLESCSLTMENNCTHNSTIESDDKMKSIEKYIKIRKNI